MDKRGVKTPLEFMPEYDELTEWLIEAFHFLSPLRTESYLFDGMIVKGHIPLSEMVAYIEGFGILMEKKEFIMIMRSIDVRYLNEYREEQIRQQEEQKANG
jgi:hypothetical protein